MRKSLLFIVLLVIVPMISTAQIKKKVSYAKGTIFAHWGYNRYGFTKSDLRLIGPGYDFTLAGAEAHDRPEKLSGVYFDLSKITIPQFNARVGYYFKDNWALSFGYDHMKYIFKDRNEVTLSGTIDPGIDSVWSGTYSGVPVITNENEFHYENSDGLNYIRFELTRTDQWLKFGQNDWFGFSTNVGVAVGGLLSFNDFTFAQKKEIKTISVSGYGVSLHTSLRFEFFKHFYIQTGMSGGFHHQVRVRNRKDDPTAYAKQKYGYAAWETVGGFFFYLKPKKKCDSCPEW